MKLKKTILLAILPISFVALKALAEEKLIDWSKTTIPPTGYEPLKTSSKSLSGKKLYEKHNCASCHQVKDEGGTTGPPLDGIGGHRGKEFLVDRLLDPLGQSIQYKELFGGKGGLMPHTGLSKKEANLIATYLLTLPEPQEGFQIQAHLPNNSENSALNKTEIAGVKLGSELFLEHGCAACHTTFDNDPRFGPSLKGISQRKERAEIEKLLGGKFKNSLMKKQAEALDPQEIRCITDFLMKLPPLKKSED